MKNFEVLKPFGPSIVKIKMPNKGEGFSPFGVKPSKDVLPN